MGGMIMGLIDSERGAADVQGADPAADGQGRHPALTPPTADAPRENPDISLGVSVRGRRVVLERSLTHDEVVTSTEPAGTNPAIGTSRPRPNPDLEEFWPPRRGHAFDEFCR